MAWQTLQKNPLNFGLFSTAGQWLRDNIWCLRLSCPAEAGVWNCHSGIQGGFPHGVPVATSASFPSSHFWEVGMLLDHLIGSLLEIPLADKGSWKLQNFLTLAIENETGRKDVYCSFKKHFLWITGSHLGKSYVREPVLFEWVFLFSCWNKLIPKQNWTRKATAQTIRAEISLKPCRMKTILWLHSLNCFIASVCYVKKLLCLKQQQICAITG